MISITCTNCKADLTIDDAFAGGVCRCQYCGTIQTVPARSKSSTTMAAPKPAASTGNASPQTIFQNTARVRQANATGTGLDDIADAVLSSGLSGSGLSSARHTKKQSKESRKNKLMPILLIVAAIVIVVMGVLLVLSMSHNGRGNGPNNSPDDNGTSGSMKPGSTLAEICGVPLQKQSVIFLLDRGNSLSNDFDALKAVTFKAIEHLGPSRQYQVILWDNDSGQMEFPAGGMHDATGQSATDVRHYFADAIATGASQLKGVLKEAVSRSPREIVVATGKVDLDDEDAAALRGLIGKNIRVNAIQIYPVTAPAMGVLQEVCKATGGKYQQVSSAELHEFSN
jgi:hypothetical protein